LPLSSTARSRLEAGRRPETYRQLARLRVGRGRSDVSLNGAVPGVHHIHEAAQDDGGYHHKGEAGRQVGVGTWWAVHWAAVCGGTGRGRPREAGGAPGPGGRGEPDRRGRGRGAAHRGEGPPPRDGAAVEGRRPARVEGIGQHKIGRSRGFGLDLGVLGLVDRERRLKPAALAVAALRIIVFSPFGYALRGIRESETRMLALGYEVWRYKLVAFVLAAAIIASMQSLGVTLIAAALVIPPIIARLLTDSFSKMMIGAGIIGAFSAAVGMYLSFQIDIASGAAIVLVGAVLFIMTLGLRAVRQRQSKSSDAALIPVHAHELFE